MKKINKIFVIGLNKAGTTSLTKALKILGLNACQHKIKYKKISEIIKENLKNKKRLFKEIEEYDAYTDFFMDLRNPDLKIIIKKIDKEYPNSKFIFLTRNKKEWIVSSIKHNKRWNGSNPNKKKRNVENERLYEESYNRINSLIKEFNKRKDFLVMDIPRGDGWEKLCPFLGKKISKKNFPHLNKSPNRIRKIFGKIKCKLKFSGTNIFLILTRLSKTPKPPKKHF